MKNYETSTLRSFRRPILRRWLRVRDRAAFRGTVAALRMLPGTLRLRSGIQRARRCPDAEFLELAR
jgi:hypothetical protein